MKRRPHLDTTSYSTITRRTRKTILSTPGAKPGTILSAQILESQQSPRTTEIQAHQRLEARREPRSLTALMNRIKELELVGTQPQSAAAKRIRCRHRPARRLGRDALFRWIAANVGIGYEQVEYQLKMIEIIEAERIVYEIG